MKQDLLKIINYYGLNKQLKYIHSEYFELDESILDFNKEEEAYYSGYSENLVKYKAHIAEEIADVMVMLKQFQYYYGIDDEQIEEIMKYKIDRQLIRIKNETNERTMEDN